MPAKLVLSEKTAGIGLGALCLVLSLALLWSWRNEESLRSRLEATGKRTKASVIAARDRSVQTGRSTRADVHTLSVFYLIDLKGYSKDFEVTRQGFEDHPQGSKVDVLYSPDNPDEAILAGEFGIDARRGWIGGAISGAFALGLFGYAARRKKA